MIIIINYKITLLFTVTKFVFKISNSTDGTSPNTRHKAEPLFQQASNYRKAEQLSSLVCYPGFP